MKQHIIIDGYVQPKERPRFWNGEAHTADKTRSYEAYVKNYCYKEHIQRMTGPIAVIIKIKKKVTHPKRYNRFKATRPDIDNLIKSVLDGLNGVAYQDDGQIVMLHAQKEYSDHDCVEIMIMNIHTPDDLEDYLDEIQDILVYENNDDFYATEEYVKPEVQTDEQILHS